MDFLIDRQGNLVVFTPMTGDARAWLRDNTASEPYQWMGDSLIVDQRCAEALAEGIVADGWSVR